MTFRIQSLASLLSSQGRLRFLSFLVLVVACSPLEAAPLPSGPTPEQIVKWIQDLGDNDFSTRENASRHLWEAGKAAEAAVQAATKSTDPEVSRRAQELADKFRWGLYPDTPKKIVELIKSYQSGDAPAKQAAVNALFEQGSTGCTALLRMVNAEADPRYRPSLLAQIGQESTRAVPGLLAEGRLDTLEELLQLCVAAETNAALPSYACFLLLRGRLDERISRLKAEPDNRRNQELLVYLYRARGDQANTRIMAEKTGKAALLVAILTEQGDWKTLARTDVPTGLRGEMEALGYRAAFQRLAGETTEFEKTIVRIHGLASDQPDEGAGAIPLVARVLFLNDRPQDALALLLQAYKCIFPTFEMLCTQMKYREAFTLADSLKDAKPDVQAGLDVRRARALYQLGEKERAQALFTGLASQVRIGHETEWQEKLIDVEYRLGLKEQAREHCARIMAVNQSPARQKVLLEKVFPGNGASAEAWWHFLRQQMPRADAPAVMKRLSTVFDGRLAGKDLAALARDAETFPGLKLDQREALLLAVAETALATGQDTLGQATMEKAVGVRESAEALQQLGGYLAERKQWESAAQRYAQASVKKPQDPLPLYLRGQVLLRAGKETEGNRLLEMARLLPLGNEGVRYTFAEALARRGQAEAARREYDLLLKTGTPGSFILGQVLRQAANDAVARKDYLKGAELHERALLRCLDPNIRFVESSAYLAVPHALHRYRALGLAAAKRFDEARRELDLCQAVLPGEVEVPVALVPVLEKHGRKKDADDVFRRCFTFQELLCRDYPRSAWAHNSAAWVAACCRRELDRALEHALKAVELAPNNSGYHDTLGEVYFQRGDKDRALAAARKSVELDPKSTYFRKQLKRIEAGDRFADLPSSGEND
jgi:tetratricopeptide (TPR) repeat protein